MSQRFLDATGLRVGGETNLVFDKVLLPIVVRGVVDYFPTMYDAPAGFIVVNQQHLYYYAGMSSENTSETKPTEAWLNFSKDPQEREAAQTALFDRFHITSGEIIDREEILDNIRTDPVVRAGGSGILLLALVAAFAILALGFALTLYLGGQARTVEVSVMRAVGISLAPALRHDRPGVSADRRHRHRRGHDRRPAYLADHALVPGSDEHGRSHRAAVPPDHGLEHGGHRFRGGGRGVRRRHPGPGGLLPAIACEPRAAHDALGLRQHQHALDRVTGVVQAHGHRYAGLQQVCGGLVEAEDAGRVGEPQRRLLAQAAFERQACRR